MDTKICSVCGLEKPKDEKNFAKASPSAPTKDGFKGRCRDCAEKKRKAWRSEYAELHGEPESRRYNQANREKFAKLHAKTEKELKDLVDELKKAPCIDCGKTFPPVCMDFDHVEGDKTAGICRMIFNRVSKEKLLAEIAKCELVCANCHRIRTHNSDRERPWYDARRKYDRSNWNAQGM